MKRCLQSVLLALIAVTVAACSSVQVEDYADNHPRLEPQSFFDGQLTAHGIIKDRAGKVIRYFNVDIKAYWVDGVGTIEEDFVFDDGELDRRVWTLTPLGDNKFIGTAGDVVGEGLITLAGNSMFLDYVLRVPYGEDTLDIRIDDRMYLVAPDVLINQSRMTKFGLSVGEIILVIRRESMQS